MKVFSAIVKQGAPAHSKPYMMYRKKPRQALSAAPARGHAMHNIVLAKNLKEDYFLMNSIVSAKMPSASR